MSVGAVNKQTGDRIPTAGMPAIDSVLSGSSTNPVQNRVVKTALDEKADTDLVASDFDATASYTAGDYCIYDGKFYKFKASHSGAWSAADVDEIKIAGELSTLESGLTNVQDDVKLNTNDLTTPSRTKNLGVTIPTASIGGIDFIAQNDGGLKAEGEATAYAYTESIFTLKAGSYILSKGANNDGGRISVSVRKNQDDLIIASVSDLTEEQFTLNSDTVVKFRASVYSGKIVDSTIYPMIRPATITDSTFAPYIPSVESRIEAVESGKANVATYNMGGGQTVNILHAGIVAIMSDRGGLYTDGIANRGLNDLIPSTQITITHVDAYHVTVANNSQYGTSILVLSDGYITITLVQ